MASDYLSPPVGSTRTIALPTPLVKNKAARPHLNSSQARPTAPPAIHPGLPQQPAAPMITRPSATPTAERLLRAAKRLGVTFCQRAPPTRPWRLPQPRHAPSLPGSALVFGTYKLILLWLASPRDRGGHLLRRPTPRRTRITPDTVWLVQADLDLPSLPRTKHTARHYRAG
jgi:hypothetical protein